MGAEMVTVTNRKQHRVIVVADPSDPQQWHTCDPDDERDTWDGDTGADELAAYLTSFSRDFAPDYLAPIADAAARADAALQERDTAIRKARSARDATVPIAAIARAAGLSRQAVYDILGRA